MLDESVGRYFRAVYHASYSARGEEFERFVSRALRGYHHDLDGFHDPRPVGRYGDGGCDGVADRGATAYACYGSSLARGEEAALATKLRKDFHTAVKQWPLFVRWRFVTNVPPGAKALGVLAELQQEHGPESSRPLDLRILDEEPFWDDVVGRMSVEQLSQLLGEPPTTSRLRPHQLPPATREFVNRTRELGDLDLYEQSAHEAGRPAVLVLHGGDGVGKTALGEEWSRRHAQRFPSGQIAVDLAAQREVGTGGTNDVLALILRDLGYTADQIPRLPDRRLALYRTVTASEHAGLLLLLDDVATAAEVRPLIPSSPRSTVVVSARSRLGDLLVDTDASLIEVAGLDEGKAELLLRHMIGDVRLEAESDAVAELLGYCEGLPLAIAVVAARLRSDDALTVDELVRRLRNESSRLEQLDVSSGRLSVIWEAAYRELPEALARAHRRLGMHPGRTFNAASAAAAVGVSTVEVETLLSGLRETHLLECVGGTPPRFRHHGLLRLHAGRMGDQAEGAAGRAAVVRRVAEHYAAYCGVLDRALVRDRLRFAPRDVCEDADSVTSPLAARQAFELERANIVAVLAAASAVGADRSAWEIAAALWPFYHGEDNCLEGIEVFSTGAEAAARDREFEVSAYLWSLVARIQVESGNVEGARSSFFGVWRLAPAPTNQQLEGTLCEAEGIICAAAEDHQSGLALFERAREIYVQLEAPRGVAIQDYLIGKAYCGLGKWIDALNAFGSAAIALTGLGDPLVLGRVLHHQGLVHAQLGELDEAMLAQSRSLQLAVQIGNRRGQAQALTALAELIDRRGDPKAAEQLRLRAARVVVQSSVGEPVFSWACSGSETREMTTRQRLLPASTSPRSPAGS